MSFTNFFELITSITGILMSLGYFLQAHKLFKTKSSHDISLAQYVVLGIGTLTWTAYGIYTRDMVIILGFLLGAIGSWLVLFLTLKYRA
ncbi:MAG: SemiSWEET family transporter, partial [Candidatus Azambacteria bacterium]|nr:SemiSWEET family transporter [Candidatus Azambacteria bacterium]